MIANLPQLGQVIIENGKATIDLHQFFEELTQLLDDFSGPSYTVATLPDATVKAGKIIYVSDESGGATLAFSDGTDWRRAQDRNVVT